MQIGEWLGIIGFVFGSGALVSVVKTWLTHRDQHARIDEALRLAEASAKRIEAALREYLHLEDTRHNSLDREVGAVRRYIVLIATQLGINNIER